MRLNSLICLHPPIPAYGKWSGRLHSTYDTCRLLLGVADELLHIPLGLIESFASRLHAEHRCVKLRIDQSR